MATRRERVVLDLDDQFSTKMARAAAATALLARELNGLDGSGKRSSRSTDEFARSADKSANSIDKLSGRVRILSEVAGLLGPSLIPVGAVGIPAVAGLASQFGFAAVAGGVAIGAFQGVGDALKAMNKAGLDPTKENLAKARQMMQDLSPAAQDFVIKIRTMIPELKKLRDSAATGMFPGLTEGLDSMESLLPKVERIVAAVSGELGDIGASTGASLASPRWADFFDFLATDAPSALADMAAAAGNTGHAMAELWMAFDPLNDDFSSWMVKATGDLDKWASGLSKTKGFEEFIGYIEKTGPQVGETLAAVANAVLQIVEAAAPIGGPVLAGIEAFANAVSAIADSDLGTPIFGMVAALSAMNLALRVSSSLSKATFGGPVVGEMRKQATSLRTLRTEWAAFNAVQRAKSGSAGMAGGPAFATGKQISDAQKFRATLLTTGAAAGKTAALIGGLAIATSGAADGIGLTNTASLALMGTMVGGGLGAAIGGTVGAAIDLTHANDGLNDSMTQLNAIAGKVDFGTFNKALDDAQAKINDLAHSDGFKDFVSDTLKGTAATLHGKGLTKSQIANSYQKDADAASVNQMQAGRARGAAAATAAAAANSALAAKGFQLVGSAAASAGQSIDGFTASVEGANAALKRDNNIDAYKTALLDAADALKENGKGLKGSTRDAIENRTRLRGVASGALEAAAGMKNFERRTLFLDRARGDFIRLAKAAGASGPEARKMANAYGLVDRATRESAGSVSELNAKIKGLKSKIVDAKAKGAKESSPQVQALRAEINRLKSKTVKADEKGSAAARGRVAALRAAIAALRDKTVTVNYHGIRTGAAGVSQSAQHSGANKDSGDRGMLFHGGVRHYAQGDVANRHMPELAGPGATRVWREPETMGEAYIPLANDDRRPRARSIAEETVGLLGGNVEWYARGGYKGNHGHKGGDNKHLSPRQRELKEFKEALEASTKAIDREKSARDAVASKRDELRSSVAGAFTSDIFGGSDVWAAGGGANPMGILRADIAKAGAFKGVLGQLAKAGLNGDAFAAVAQTGDIGKAQAIAAMGKAGIGQFEQLFNQRAAVASSVGNAAGYVAYQGQINTMNHHLAAQIAHGKRLEHQIAVLTKEMKGHPEKAGKATGKAINGAARAGQRKKAHR